MTAVLLLSRPASGPTKEVAPSRRRLGTPFAEKFLGPKKQNEPDLLFGHTLLRVRVRVCLISLSHSQYGNVPRVESTQEFTHTHTKSWYVILFWRQPLMLQKKERHLLTPGGTFSKIFGKHHFHFNSQVSNGIRSRGAIIKHPWPLP